MQWGDGSLGTKPGIDSDLFLFSIAQATVIRDADVLLQLWDLVEQLVLSKVPDILCLGSSSALSGPPAPAASPLGKECRSSAQPSAAAFH